MQHPSGPLLTGHAACGPGKIFDHKTQRCISVLAYRKQNPDSNMMVRGAIMGPPTDEGSANG